MLPSIVVAAEETAKIDLPIPPVAYGLIAFGALIVLLAVTYAFRSVGSRH